jgi:lantibiotic modifying enzyme
VESAVGAVSAAAPVGPPARADAAPAANDRLSVLARPLRPFLDWVGERLTAATRDCLRPEHADPGLLAGAYLAMLGERLGRLALPALTAEFGTAPAAGDEDGRAAEFAARLCAPDGLMRFLARYPVLARQLGVTSQFSLAAGIEAVRRFAADRPAIVAELLGGTDPGPAVALRPGLGDQHCSGRSVMAVTFADGRALIYKPRSQAGHALFGEILGWINQRVPGASLRGPAMVSRPDYGWLELIANDPLPAVSAAVDFYRREGILLAALYATHASDMHYENVIANGAVPVIIDVETLFHPALPGVSTTGGDPAAEALAGSVYRAALLPRLTVDENGVADKSGMCGDGHAKRLTGNRPHFDGKPVGPAGYEAALIEGFQLGYAAIAAEQASFSRLIERGADLEVRTVIRESRGYADLIGQSSHPDLLRDPDRLDEVFGVLREVSAAHPVWARLAEHEIADLWNGDIPLLTSHACSSDLLTSTGGRIPGVLDRPGLRCALDKVATMDDADLRRQGWIIAASLATSQPHEGHRGRRAAAGSLTAIAAGPDRLLAAACGLADQIVADASTWPDNGGERVNWLGLQLVQDTHWMLLPMGAGLADGYLGVALFLAQLGQLTGISRYTDVAWRSLGAVPSLLAVLGAQAEWLPAVGCGGTQGLGGISYGLARLSVLLHDAELASQADLAVELAAGADLTATPGWTAGTAGCLAAMMSVQAETGSRRAAELARTCAGLLRGLVEETGGRCAPDDRPVPAGFAGPAGVGWALTRFADVAADPACRRAGHRATQYAIGAVMPALSKATGAASAISVGWCSGLAGLLLARSSLPVGLSETAATESGAAGVDAAGADAAIRALDREAVLADLSLCHGELGVAEAFTVLAATGSEAAYHARRRREGIVLDIISRQASYCGTPGGLATPGLFTGLAGIGYGLLRLGFTEKVPSVLLLEPGLAT